MGSNLSCLCDKLEEILEVEEGCKSMGITVAYTVAWLERVDESGKAFLERAIEEALNEIPKQYTLENLKSHPIVRAYRNFFWRLGIDPTKTRPSSEALIRRALRGSFPRINDVVDVGNIASLKTLVCIGMYDIDKAGLPLKLTISKGGERFKPIGSKEEMRLKPGIPILIDSRGVVMHLYPHRDSVETCVSESTRRILVLAAGVPEVPKEQLIMALNIIKDLLNRLGWACCENIVVK